MEESPKCAWPICQNIAVGTSNRRAEYCSKKCKNKAAVSRRRKKVKQLALDYKGGKCSRCGYVKCLGALVFHHTTNDKEFNISLYGHCRSWERVKAELDKCILVCTNCHAEIHETEGY